MSSQQILPVNNTPQASGQGQKANGIVQTQQPQQSGAWVLCDNGTVYINGQVQFSPPQPIADSSKIFSPDMSSQLQCINGGQITVLGEIQGYSTTAQTNSSIGTAIGDLSTVYQSIDTTLDGIPLAENAVNLNQQKIENLANPSNLQDAVNLQYLQNNYSDTTQSQSFVNNAIGDLSTVYQSINTTLDAIPLAENSVDVNNFKIVNLLPGTQPTDAVNLSQLDGYIPITGNINDLTAQTADYDTSGFQITVSNPPTAVDDLTNKQYVDGEISALSTVYYPQTDTLNDIALPTMSMDFNGQKLQNIGMNNDATDAVRQDYLETYYLTQGDAANIYQQITEMVNYVQTGFLTANYYTQTYINNTFATISSLSNYVTSSSLATTLSNYVTLTYLQQNYYDSSYIDSVFATIASLSNYVTNSSLATTLSGYLTTSAAASTYQTIADMTNYYTKTTADATFATISSLSNYVTNSSLATTLSSYVTNSSLATTLSGYLQIANIGAYTTFIQTNSGGTKSKVDCSTNSQILFNIADVQKLRMYVPAGQSTQPLGLIADDKIQMVSGENSFSLTGQKALQAKPTQNFSGLYISGLDNAALNVGQQIQIGSQFCQKLALASGHTDIGGGTQVLYSTISNSAEGVAQQNLQISGGTPQTDNTIVLYSDTYAAALGQNLTAQFTKKTGYSTTTAITEANQFSSKTYVDTAISGLSSVYLTITNAASTYQTIANMSNYYTKTVTDATFATISSLSNYVTSLSLATTLSDYLTISNAASTYQTIADMSNYYTKTVTDATFATISSLSNYVTNSSLATTLSGYLTTSAAASTYVLQTTPLNDLAVPTGDLAMEGFEIKGLQLVPSVASSATSKSYVDSAISGLSSVYATLALTYSRVASDARFYLNTVTLNNITAPTGSLDMNSQKIINCLDPTLAQDVATKNYVDTQSGSGITLATAKANFIALDGTQTNLITAPIPMNSQKITDLANGTNATDAVNVSQLTTNINSAISGVSQVLTGTVQMWPTTSAPSGYLICDGSTYSSATYPDLFAILGSTTLPDFRDKFARGFDSTSGRTILDVQQDAYADHLHQITGQTYTTNIAGSHSHPITRRQTQSTTATTALDDGSGGSGTLDGTFTTQTAGDHTHSVIIPTKNTDLSTTGSTETRPINICLNFIIKY